MRIERGSLRFNAWLVHLNILQRHLWGCWVNDERTTSYRHCVHTLKILIKIDSTDLLTNFNKAFYDTISLQILYTGMLACLIEQTLKVVMFPRVNLKNSRCKNS